MILTPTSASVPFGRCFEKARAKKQLFNAIFELTHHCNFDCAHCYIPKKQARKELSFSEIKSIIDQLYKSGCLYITFTGGEIFTRNDIFEILEHAKKRCMRINLFTNGSLIDSSAAERLARLGGFLNRIEISFLGATARTFETITRTPGSFKRVTKAIKLLRDMDRSVALKIVLMRQNQHEIPRFLKAIRAHDCKGQFSAVVFSKNDGDTQPLAYRLSPPEAHAALKNVFGNGIDLEGLGCNSGECLMGKTSAVIDPYGKMSSCLLIRRPGYDLLEIPVNEAWEKIKVFLEKFYKMNSQECKSCSLKRQCMSCPGFLMAETGRLNGCSEWMKKVAILKMRDNGHF